MKYSVFLLVAVIALALNGCDNPTSPVAAPATEPVAPPETPPDNADTARPAPENVQRFVGTAAFEGQKSASITVTIGVSGSGLSSLSTTRSVGGSVLYEGATLDVTGTFDTATGALAATATGTVGGDSVIFTLSGTYEPDGGFTGTITRTIADTTVDGAVALLEIADTEEPTVVESFRGTFTGTASGSWNISTRGSTATGTWMLSDGTGSGILRGTRSGNTVTVTPIDANNTPVTRPTTGTISGTSISGAWTDDYDGAGSWSGTKD